MKYCNILNSYLKVREIAVGSWVTDLGDNGKVTEDLEIAMPALAFAWVLRKKIVGSVIVGASKAIQLESNLKAVDVRIPEEALTEIDRILGFVKFERHVGLLV
ncbi:MAG: aldo/keto reductase [Cellulosilyticum sp.]|nr:aldo/keto reductase [Cellulosilyticum sp.]